MGATKKLGEGEGRVQQKRGKGSFLKNDESSLRCQDQKYVFGGYLFKKDLKPLQKCAS